MRILVTNDDGINAPGLAAAEQLASGLAGPEGEVWTVAPAVEQSAVSHAISYVRPMRIEQLGERRFAVEGTPADCVFAGLSHVLKDTPPDLVLSGVNRGHNVAEDVVYSGTIGAAMEATMHGLPAIAMSLYMSDRNVDLPDPFNPVLVHGPELLRKLLDQAPWADQRYGVFYNVNFPPCPADEVKGTRTTFQGARPGPSFFVDPVVAPNGRSFMWLKSSRQNAKTETTSDAYLTSDGYISVTPLRADLTAYDVIDPLKDIFDA